MKKNDALDEKLLESDFWSLGEREVLCGASSYKRVYFLNPKFSKLPKKIKEELEIMCVAFCEDAGGILTLEFDEFGELGFFVRVDDADIYFDDIESGMRISMYQRRNRDLLSQIEAYYKIAVLGMEIEI